MEDLKVRLRGHVQSAYMPVACRHTMDEAADRIEALEALLGEIGVTYAGMETGDGEPCPLLARIDALLRKGGE